MACSTYHVVDIDVLSPSPYQVPTSVQHISIINNAQEQASNVGHVTYKQNITYSSNSKKKKMSDDIIQVDSTTTSAIHNMYNYLEESMLFTDVRLARTSPKPHIYYGNIEQAFQSYPSDAILFLESLTYTDILTYHYDQYFLNEPEIEIKTRSQWLLYYGDDLSKPYRFTVKDTLYWNTVDVDRAECVIEGVWNNAKLAAERITPHWVSVNRLYYTGSSFAYSQIDEAIKNQNWEEAGTLWISLYNSESKNTKRKGRMAFNMALLFEMKNDIETSVMWLNNAIEIFTEKGAENELQICSLYASVLDNRLNIQKKLDQQFTY